MAAMILCVEDEDDLRHMVATAMVARSERRNHPEEAPGV